MIQMAHKKEPARTKPTVPRTETKTALLLTQLLKSNQILSSGPEDCEPLVDPEDFGKGGVEVESEYDLELRIGGNVGRPGMGHSSLLTVQTVRW
jgi:hypothetical protein